MKHDMERPRPSIFDTLKEKHLDRATSPAARPLPNPSRRRRPPMFRPVGRSPRSTAGLVAVIAALFACGGLGLSSLYRPSAERDMEAAREQAFPHTATEPRTATSPRAPAHQEDPVAGPPPVRTEDVRESQGGRVAALDPAAVPPPTIEPRSEPAPRPAPVRDDPEPTAEPKPAAVAAREAPPGALVDDRPAVKVFSARPDYPEAARLAGIAGTVIVEAEVDTAGSVASTRVLRGVSPELDQAARKAVERWRFEPATSNGEPRTDLYRAAIHFELKPSTEPEAEVASLLEGGSAPSSEPESAVASLPEEEFEPPVRLYAPPPTYPPDDWVAAVEGDVVVKAAISETGRVTGVEILQGLSAGLNRAAIEALKHWRFRPATRQGEAVAAHQVFTFRFAR